VAWFRWRLQKPVRETGVFVSKEAPLNKSLESDTIYAMLLWFWPDNGAKPGVGRWGNRRSFVKIDPFKDKDALLQYETMIGYQVRAGAPLEQAKAEAGLSESDKPAQYYIDLVNEAAKTHPLKTKNLLRWYENAIGYRLLAGRSFEQAKAEEEDLRIFAGLPLDINKPAQYFIELVEQMWAAAKPHTKPL
jgi:hypothetical protein